MKAMILAAGEGHRLRPLTDTTPKPMLPIAGKPLLEHILINLRSCGITSLAINLYHLPQPVIDYFGDGSAWHVTIRYSVEERLWGSAGGVKRVEDFFDDTFVVYYGDVLTWFDLRPMIAFHHQSKSLATLALNRVPDPWNRGVVTLNAQGLISQFVEKPPRDHFVSDLGNAGIYVLQPQILPLIPKDQPFDFGKDLFPLMLANGLPLSGYEIADTLIDIGLPEKYNEANQIAQSRTAYC